MFTHVTIGANKGDHKAGNVFPGTAGRLSVTIAIGNATLIYSDPDAIHDLWLELAKARQALVKAIAIANVTPDDPAFANMAAMPGEPDDTDDTDEPNPLDLMTPAEAIEYARKADR